MNAPFLRRYWDILATGMVFLKIFFWCTPFVCLYFLSFLIMNEPGLGEGIDPDMALTPLPSSIGRGSIPRPSNREPSTLPLDHSFRYNTGTVLHTLFLFG